MTSRSADDESFLDAILDRAIELLDENKPVRVDDLLSGRDHLRAEVEHVVRIAHETAVGRSVAPPQIAGYAILRELGRGGMGSVFLAHQQRLGGRPVALKVLPPASMISPRARDRFLREANALAKLEHPNVITVHDVVEDEEICAYAMEWVEGPSLAQIIEALAMVEPEPSIDDVRRILGASPAPIPDISVSLFVARLGLAIARALAVVHDAGLLHRDVKPSNILVKRDGTPLLADFGLARDAETTIHTHAGRFVGTPAYAPPEQLRGEQDRIDARSDVYALGATLYHALALRPPFASGTTTRIVRRAEHGLAEPLRNAAPKLPRDLQTIVAKAMDPEPHRRYASAGDLADDLDRLLNLQPVSARPAGPLRRATKFLQRNRRTAAAAIAGATLAVLLITIGGLYTLLFPRLAANEVRSAHLKLLNPYQSDRVLAARYEMSDPDRNLTPLVTAIPTALAHYGRALRLRPFDSSIRRERDTVALAGAIIAGEFIIDDSTGDLSVVEDPLQQRYLRARGRAESLGLAQETTADLARLGLLAHLTGDMPTALEAWRLCTRVGNPQNAFVQAALGQWYLTEGHAAKAFTYLEPAVREYDEAAFLWIDLAQAAIGAERLDDARECLDRSANALPADDPFFSHRRAEAMYSAAIGDLDTALSELTWFRRHRQNPPAREALAELLLRSGELNEVVRIYLELVQLRPRVTRFRSMLVETADRWWERLDETTRFTHIKSVLGPDSFFAELAIEYAASRNLTESAPAATASSSRTLGESTLLETIQLLETSNMNHLPEMRRYPSFLKNIVVAGWLSDNPAAHSAIAALFYRAGQRARQRAVRAGLITALLAAGQVQADVAVDDDFNDGELDPAWEIVFEGADDWTWDETDGEFVVTDIVDPVSGDGNWGSVHLRQQFAPVGDFAATVSIRWDETEGNDPNDALQQLWIHLLDQCGNRVVVAGFRDNWLCCPGTYLECVESDCVAPDHDDDPQPYIGTAQWSIVRNGSDVSVTRDGVEIISGTSTRPIAELDLEFSYYKGQTSEGTSFFGTEAVDWVLLEGTPVIPPIGDLDCDFVVGFSDLVALLAAWGPCPGDPDPCCADLNEDGDVGFADLIILLSNWS